MPSSLSQQTITTGLNGSDPFLVSRRPEAGTGSAIIGPAVVQAIASDQSFNISSGSFVTAGFAEGDHVYVAGFTDTNNNLYSGRITALTPTKMTIGGADGAGITDATPAYAVVTITKWVSRRADTSRIGEALANDVPYPAKATQLSDPNGAESIFAARLSSSIRITSSEISAAAADNSFNYEGNPFVLNFGDFAVGDWVHVQGFSTSANNIYCGVVEDVSSIKMIIRSPQGDSIATEAAGNSIRITKWVPRRVDLRDIVRAAPVEFQVAASDETTALTTGTAKVTFRVHSAYDLDNVIADLNSAQSSGSVLTIDVKKNGTSIFSTLLTIDNGEETSTTAATPCVLSSSTLAAGDKITVDITQVGTGATGLKLIFVLRPRLTTVSQA